MITNTELTPDQADSVLKAADATTKRALDLYGLHPRRRFVELDEETKTALGNLLQGCQETQNARAFDLFKEALEKLTDEHGLNVLRPAEKQKRVLPQAFTDPTTGQAVENPFKTGNKKDQRALLQHAPELAEHLRRLAKTPNEYLIELAAEENERLEANKREAEYTAAVHSNNVFANGANKTDQAAFANACDDPALVTQYIREAKPVTIAADLFEPHPKSTMIMGNQTLQGRVVRADRVLFTVIQAAQERARSIAVARHQQKEIQKRADAILAARQAKASAELAAGITHLADGRIISMGS